MSHYLKKFSFQYIGYAIFTYVVVVLTSILIGNVSSLFQLIMYISLLAMVNHRIVQDYHKREANAGVPKWRKKFIFCTALIASTTLTLPSVVGSLYAKDSLDEINMSISASKKSAEGTQLKKEKMEMLKESDSTQFVDSISIQKLEWIFAIFYLVSFTLIYIVQLITLREKKFLPCTTATNEPSTGSN